MNSDNDKDVINQINQAIPSVFEPFSKAWEKSLSSARMDTDIDLKIKLRAEFMLASLLTITGAIGLGLLLRFTDILCRQPLWQLAH